MSWPKSKSRKGLFLRVQWAWSSMERNWRPHRGDWQPSKRLREQTKRQIADMRKALDEWEAKL